MIRFKSSIVVDRLDISSFGLGKIESSGKRLSSSKSLFGNNKISSHPKDLFSERKKIIEWFEKNHPENFKFYGLNWDKKYFSKPRILRTLNRVNFVSKLFGTNYSTYGGWVDDKLATLKNYKFSICFENVYGFTGYITEKIFDSFLGSCIPIYLGL